MDTDIFIANVKARCKALGTTPTVACAESGAGKNLITYMKNGSSPSLKRVKLLADYLGCSIDDLTGEVSRPDLPPMTPNIVRLLNEMQDMDEDEVLQIIGAAQFVKSKRK